MIDRLKYIGPLLFRAAQSRILGPYSIVVIVNDGYGWALDEGALALQKICKQMGVRSIITKHRLARFFVNQWIFIFSRNAVADPFFRSVAAKNKVMFPYYHGIPNPRIPEFSKTLTEVLANQDVIWRIQVTNRDFRNVLLRAGCKESLLKTIHIGIDSEKFIRVDAGARRVIRAKYGISDAQFVIGSFQKDGEGWNEGQVPKWIKGPDVFVELCRRLHRKTPHLLVFLSGPARGFVKAELTKLGIPYLHQLCEGLEQVAELYHCLDLYAVTSRDEGGPNAILEAMASGVPLISTRVGQAVDLINNGVNGWMVDVDDVDGLVAAASTVLALSEPSRAALLDAARTTAEQHDHRKQLPLWKDFIEGERT